MIPPLAIESTPIGLIIKKNRRLLLSGFTRTNRFVGSASLLELSDVLLQRRTEGAAIRFSLESLPLTFDLTDRVCQRSDQAPA